jgi:hypothetical protein
MLININISNHVNQQNRYLIKIYYELIFVIYL